MNWFVRDGAEVILDPRHPARGETPVVVAKVIKIRDAVSFEPAGEIDKRIEVTQRHFSEGSIDCLAPMQPGVARARDRAPAPVLLEDVDHVVQEILRLQTQQQRRIAVLFEYHCRADCRFETVSFLSFENFTKRSNSAAILLPVVRERTEVALYPKRSVELLDEFPLGIRETFCVGNHA